MLDRRPLHPALALASLLAASASAQPPPEVPGGDFGEELSVEVVIVDVWVSDREGEPVSGLERKSFRLLEDGVPVEIQYFDGPEATPAAPAGSADRAAAAAPAPEPRYLVIYFDGPNLGPGGRHRVLQGLRELLDGTGSPADQFMVVLFDGAPKILLPFTSDRGAVSEALDRVAELPAGGIHTNLDRRRAYQRMRDLYAQYEGGRAELVCGGPCGCAAPQMLGAAVEYAEEAAGRVRASASGLSQLATALSGLPGAKFVLYVSDGLEQQPGLDLFHFAAEVCPEQEVEFARYYGAYDQNLAFHDLAARANSHGVTFFPVEAQGPGTDADAAEGGTRFRASTLTRRIREDNAEAPLTQLALATGGRAILNANDFGPELTRVAEELGGQYSLGFVPSHHGDGRLHRLDVEVAGRGLRVRHREIYWDQPLRERLASRTFGTLVLGAERDPLGVTVTPEAPFEGPAGCCRVPIQVRVSPGALTVLPGEDGGRSRVYVVLTGRSSEGDLLPTRGQALEVPAVEAAGGAARPISIVVDLAPGRYELAVGVVDLLGSEASYVRKEIEVARPEDPR